MPGPARLPGQPPETMLYSTLERTIAVPTGSNILLQVASYWDIEV